ncbi:DoxX family protein [Seohaeicola zhoushanensis]|uniref:DoxX family protein n=1 Tax=Seohaeicola zhoushanensis TaxID=1569283 RepID=A0A8J3H3G9_9RHOB|nr:DoxX family protein [Seohaeicola zhoushanensis]GHF73461.1 hypothetical protein GCM10017056_50380 [Seohaeicola zhoushanensis]
MIRLINLYLRLAAFAEFRIAPALMPTLARLVFAGVLLVYYLKSGLTKLGDGLTGLYQPSAGAFAQIYPKVAEALHYNIAAATPLQKAVVLAGTWAEFLLPVLVVIGLFTRPAALGMAAFVVVQTLTDIYGHGVDAKSLGSWFDPHPGGAILDQRALWLMLLLVLVFRGGGPLAVDRIISRWLRIA